MDNTIDRTPCNLCTHFDVCSYKLSHEANVTEVAGYVDANASVDLIYVKCTKFIQKSNAYIPRELPGIND